MSVGAKELKEALGEAAKDIIANGMGLIEKNKKVLCPLHQENTPSMTWYKEGLMWRCHSCQGQIDIYTYLNDHENLSFREAMEKVADTVGISIDNEPIKAVKTKYNKPNIETRDLGEKLTENMVKRKISPETLKEWRVKERTWNGQDVYVFQYFNENEELEHVSYRGREVKGGCEKGTKPILWGMWHIDRDKPLVITEGQPDAMVVWQAGYKNVVSVPSGSANLGWIEHNWEWLQGIKEFIVYADNDKPGLEMAEKIKKRLHNVKILQTEEYNDANDLACSRGEKEVLKVITEEINSLPPGIVDVAHMDYKTEEEADFIETGFYDYDSFVEDWETKEVTVIFGRNNEGKTTFVSQIVGHCLEKKVKTFLYSGEMSDQKIQEWLYRQLIGSQSEHLEKYQAKYREKVRPKKSSLKKIKKWHENTFYLYERPEKDVINEIVEFFKVMETAAKRYGVKLFIIDNLMSILEENADSLYSDQANFVSRCKEFAKDNDVHIVLLAHPNKGKGELTDETTGNLDKTDISGSNNIANKADNILAVERNWAESGDCDAIVTSLKNRTNGQRKVFRYFFSQETLRFYNSSTAENKIYGWQKIDEKEYGTQLDIQSPFKDQFNL